MASGQYISQEKLTINKRTRTINVQTVRTEEIKHSEVTVLQPIRDLLTSALLT